MSNSELSFDSSYGASITYSATENSSCLQALTAVILKAT